MHPCIPLTADEFPEVAQVKRIAARYARAHTNSVKDECRAKLRQLMEGFHLGKLNRCRTVVMIDHRWQGATGAGGYWAVASELVNEVASEILRTKPAFLVED